MSSYSDKIPKIARTQAHEAQVFWCHQQPSLSHGLTIMQLLTERFATIQGGMSVELQVVPLLGHLVVVIWPWPLCCRFWHCACLNATSTAICRWGIHHHEHRLWQRLWHHGRPPSWGILEVHGAHIAHGIDGSPESLSRATYK